VCASAPRGVHHPGSGTGNDNSMSGRRRPTGGRPAVITDRRILHGGQKGRVRRPRRNHLQALLVAARRMG
jgi:hypothetical protein